MTRNTFYKILLAGLFLLASCTNRYATATTQPVIKETETSIDSIITATAVNTMTATIAPSPISDTSTSNSTINEKFLIIDQRDYYLSTLDGLVSLLLFSGKDSPIEMASLSPDQTQFAYFKDNFIYIQNIETRTTFALNKDVIGSAEGNIKWSPDGKKLFMSCANSQQPSMAVCVIDTSNGQIDVLLNEKNTDEICHIDINSIIAFQDISSDGTKTVYSCSIVSEQGQRAPFAVYIYDMVSKTSAKILDSQTQDAVWEFHTVLLPRDGNSLLIDGADQNHMLNVYLLDWKTGTLKQLTGDPTYHFVATAWNNKESFYLHRTSVNKPYTEENFLMDTNGRILSTLEIQGMITR